MVGRGTKSDRIRVLLTTTDYSAIEIAEMVKSDISLVRHCRRKLRIPHSRQTIEARVSMVLQEVSELRARVRAMESEIGDPWELRRRETLRLVRGAAQADDARLA